MCQSNIIYYMIYKLIFYILFLNYKNLQFKQFIDDIVLIFNFLEILQVWRI